MGSCGSWRKLAEKAVAGIKGALLDWDDILAFRSAVGSRRLAVRFIRTTFNG